MCLDACFLNRFVKTLILGGEVPSLYCQMLLSVYMTQHNYTERQTFCGNFWIVCHHTWCDSQFCFLQKKKMDFFFLPFIGQWAEKMQTWNEERGLVMTCNKSPWKESNQRHCGYVACSVTIRLLWLLRGPCFWLIQPVILCNQQKMKCRLQAAISSYQQLD